MRIALVAIAVLAATSLVACGGNEKGTPLTLEQRVLRESDAPRSLEDPIEVRLTAANLDEFTAWRNEEYVRAAYIEPSKLKKAGFVAAAHETRFFPKTPGGPHTRDAPHVRTLVIQFTSEDGATTGASLVYTNDLKPCPGQCAVQIEEFEPSGVPDAKGARHFIPAKRLEETGGEDVPFDSYTVTFTDGPFVYQVDGFAPPGKISKEQIEEIADTVYERVKGAPPAGPSSTASTVAS
jgi:hypothetical protein